VANWFYGAFILTIAVLHIFNNLSIPELTKSYPSTPASSTRWCSGGTATTRSASS
jgi:cbb3-type cytochrome oxidase subunit 1